MAIRNLRKRGSGVIALIAVLAALAGPSAAVADTGKSQGNGSALVLAYKYAFSFGVDASWVEE
jgi:hypothetical protein